MCGKSDPAPTGPISRWTGKVLDLVYPPLCALCGDILEGGRSLCGPCGDGLPLLEPPFCASCGEGFPGRIDGPFDCPNCKDLVFSFEFARPVLVRDPRTLELVHRLKYQKQLHLAEELGRFAVRALEDARFADALAEEWTLVPVPLHRSRLRDRYFNQALEIGRVMSRLSGLPMVDGLARIRRTDTQTRLSRAQRLKNLRGAFALNARGRRCLGTAPAGIILVDDVLTTGSTVEACAKTLRQAGCPRVCVVTVMRG